MLTDKELVLFTSGTNEQRNGIFQAWLDCPSQDDIRLFAIPSIGYEFVEGFWLVLNSGRNERCFQLDQLALKLGLMMVCEILPE